MLYTIRTSANFLLSSIVYRQSSVLKGVLMTNKHLFSRPKTSAISAFSAVKNSCLCVFVAINPFNQRNLRLINDLRPCKALYNCRGYTTNVVDSLQINLFMQNKANFRKVKLNVNKVLTKNYEQMDTWSIGKTKPIQSQSKPIQTQLKPIKCQNEPK